MHAETLTVETRGRGFHEITEQAQRVVSDSGAQHGLCHVFIHHTSASLTITENADPDVLADLETVYAGLAPDGDARYRHTAEGPDDMSAHVRSALTQTSIGIPVADGQLALGTWQGLYVWEHRTRAHVRKVTVSVAPA
jgi:secondary thiamine-phosphate synthase enzyme